MMAAERIELEIDGMHCEACVRRVTAALTRSGAGPVNAVSLGAAAVEAEPESAPMLLASLAKAGFTARVLSRVQP